MAGEVAGTVAARLPRDNFVIKGGRLFTLEELAPAPAAEPPVEAAEAPAATEPSEASDLPWLEAVEVPATIFEWQTAL